MAEGVRSPGTTLKIIGDGIDRAAVQFQRTERRRAAIENALPHRSVQPAEPAISQFNPFKRRDAL